MSALEPRPTSSGLFDPERMSLTDKRWHILGADARLAEWLVQQMNLPPLLAEILAQKGFQPDQAAAFLTPTLKQELPDPAHLHDMEKATRRLAQALEKKEPVHVLADYDVDGATSGALLRRYAQALGTDFGFTVPDRMQDGYGPNPALMEKIHAAGAKLLICVDCGTLAFAAMNRAHELGLDVIILDHHQAEPELPPAHAIVNPNRLDQASTVRHIAAVGVTFLFLVALNRHLRAQNFWQTQNKEEPDLRRWLDLVAVGTVCDVMPLTGLNRAFVTQGVKVLQNAPQTGFHILAQVGGTSGIPDTQSIGFSLGPRINAGGRVGESDLGLRLLSTDDPEEATALALKLDAHNTRRRILESETLEAARKQARDRESQQPNAVMVMAEGWHPGILGILAARLKEEFARPAIVVGFHGEDGKGSGRSVAGIDIGAATLCAAQIGLLTSGGGHAMACGLSIRREKWPEFCAFMQERLKPCAESESPETSLVISTIVTLRALSDDMAEQFMRLAPFGAGNPEPLLLLPDCQILNAGIVGTNHVRCQIGQGGKRVKAIAFRQAETPLGTALLSEKNLHIVGTLRQDLWQGRSQNQILIRDARLV